MKRSVCSVFADDEESEEMGNLNNGKLGKDTLNFENCEKESSNIQQKSPSISNENESKEEIYLYDEFYQEEQTPKSLSKSSSNHSSSKYGSMFLQRSKERRKQLQQAAKESLQSSSSSIVILTEGYQAATKTSDKDSHCLSDKNEFTISSLKQEDSFDREKERSSFIQSQIMLLKDQRKQQFQSKYLEILSQLTENAPSSMEIRQAKERYHVRCNNNTQK